MAKRSDSLSVYYVTDIISDPFMSSFRMGLSVRKETVIIDGREKTIDSVLVKGGSRMAVS